MTGQSPLQDGKDAAAICKQSASRRLAQKPGPHRNSAFRAQVHDSSAKHRWNSAPTRASPTLEPRIEQLRQTRTRGPAAPRLPRNLNGPAMAPRKAWNSGVTERTEDRACGEGEGVALRRHADRDARTNIATEHAKHTQTNQTEAQEVRHASTMFGHFARLCRAMEPRPTNAR